MLLKVNAALLRNNNKEAENDYPLKYWITAVEKSYSDSGLFNKVSINKYIENADFVIQINYDIRRSHIFILGCLYSLTSTLVPSRTKVEINITVTFKKIKNKSMTTYKNHESMVTYAQMFMIFVAPFTDVNEFQKFYKQYEDICYDLNMTILKEAYKDGVFK